MKKSLNSRNGSGSFVFPSAVVKQKAVWSIGVFVAVLCDLSLWKHLLLFGEGLKLVWNINIHTWLSSSTYFCC